MIITDGRTGYGAATGQGSPCDDVGRAPGDHVALGRSDAPQDMLRSIGTILDEVRS